ncbi:hypothetical protein RRG08_008310 [Elysia crispata]|uniref:Uncharacterized protein n=1 Tax=Elysia crispata TaxID=231223 RepID=A0AAE0ZMA0_9GAST|nr:hypothetical protein RRG08_008310 [Elysia crispata]
MLSLQHAISFPHIVCQNPSLTCEKPRSSASSKSEEQRVVTQPDLTLQQYRIMLPATNVRTNTRGLDLGLGLALTISHVFNTGLIRSQVEEMVSSPYPRATSWGNQKQPLIVLISCLIAEYPYLECARRIEF